MNEKRLGTFASILQGIQALAMIYALAILILWTKRDVDTFGCV